MTRSLGKMGKSLKNAVGPDEVSEQYGCDTVRLYEMYMGPLDASKPWEPRDIIGMHRFLQRVWRNLAGEGDAPTDGEARRRMQLRPVHKAIKAVTESMEQLKFNTAIAALIDLNGEMLRWTDCPEDERGGVRPDAGAARPPSCRGAVVEARPRGEPRVRALARV